MISTWMLYAALVALVIGAAAWILERATRDHRVPSRWIWTVALIASGLFPLVVAVAPSARDVLPAPVTSPEDEAYPSLEPLATFGASSSGAIGPIVIDDGRGPALPQLPRALDPIALGGWILLSLGLLIGLLQAFRALRRARRGWLAKHVDGRDIFVSDEVGPALVGVLHPSIVMPRWALALSPRDRELMLRHEEEHKLAGDAPLLFAALLFLVLLPWNLPLWWQLRRLRLAVEVDCDRRVLERTRDLRRYAALLVEIGRRRTRLPMSIALAEPASFLERRIRDMTTRPRPRYVRSAGMIALASALVAAVGQVEAPVLESAPSEPTALHEVTLQPDALQQVTEPERPTAPGVDPSVAASPLPALVGATRVTASESPAVKQPAAPLAGQIRGVVTDAATSQPLADAKVYIVGSNLASVSTSAGAYALTDVPAGTHELRVERVGYSAASRVVALTDGAVLETSFALTPDEPSRIRLRGTAARISGRATAPSGAPLADVQVYLVGANLGAITRQTGQYLILNVPAGTYTLRAERIGLATSEQQITVVDGGVQEVNFVLDGDPQANPLTQAIGNARIQSGSFPLIYIDGVLQPRGPDGAPEGSLLQRLDATNIERVEVIKGAAAIQNFGPEAAAGVIQVFTKRPPAP